MITDGRFIFSSVLLVFVRFFRFRIKFSLIPALKHAVNRHFWHRCRSVPDVKSHEFWPNRQMYSTLLSTDLLKKPLFCSAKYWAMEIAIFRLMTNKNLYSPHKIEPNNEIHLTGANKLRRLHFQFLLFSSLLGHPRTIVLKNFFFRNFQVKWSNLAWFREIFPRDRFRFGLKSFPGSFHSLYIDAIGVLFCKNRTFEYANFSKLIID